jgi:hypothetical protein
LAAKTWWLTSLALTVVVLGAQVIPIGLAFVSESLAVVGVGVSVVVMLVACWCLLALQAKRWHDLDKSAWWIARTDGTDHLDQSGVITAHGAPVHADQRRILRSCRQ